MSETEQHSIEEVETGKLEPYAKNAKMHSQQQISAVAGSIKEFGFCNPVLIDGAGTIIAGHCRVQAAQMLGMATVPCIRLTHLTEDEKRAYIIADNRLAELGSSWDYEMLKVEMDSIDFSKFDGLKAEDFSFKDMAHGEETTKPEKDAPIGEAGIQGEDDRTGHIIISYENESEKQLWADRLGISGDKVVYTIEDIIKEEVA